MDERSTPRDDDTRIDHQLAISKLHATAQRVLEATADEEVAEIVVESVRDVLELPINAVWLTDADGTELRPIAWTDHAVETVGEIPTFRAGDSLAWDALERGAVEQYDDVSTVDGCYNRETPIRSEIILPLGDHGVLTIGSTDAAAFGELDVALGELVATYASTVLDRIESERKLREANDQYEAAIRAGAVGTWEWSIPDDEFVTNPKFARTFGVDPDAARDGVALDRFVSAVHEDDREHVERSIEEAIDSCGEYEAEYRVRNDDGRMRWVVARGHVECDEDGEPVRFPGALTDVTERKRYERQLERQNERLNEFASVVSHDLRNPLQVATGRLELARESTDDPNLDEVAAALERMSVLIDDLLTLSRKGDRVGETEPIDLATLGQQCWQAVATSEATLATAVDCTILADRGRLRQLFENLYRNAIDHGGEDVTVTVGRLETGFYVEDTGSGIPPAERERVFETGYSTSEEGTGFGLRIVEQAATAHGWEIDVAEGSRGGVRFEITGVEFVS
ncbi:sensor histidine kinase [Natrarchaeobius oligotrophus]|uniref:histidine kinase n=1 Tax=Natrarchaeobius chitinivorans TaxID=1679083 RepID=A0A3N6MDD1_NATCH|nr:GAF domain-containing sensor histidine kinase [Natrarchaeobius chitinivorans]RQH01869.1 PAS domain S-box protein [Natrarchaeobius chitinivorans]